MDSTLPAVVEVGLWILRCIHSYWRPANCSCQTTSMIAQTSRTRFDDLQAYRWVNENAVPRAMRQTVASQAASQRECWVRAALKRCVEQRRESPFATIVSQDPGLPGAGRTGIPDSLPVPGAVPGHSKTMALPRRRPAAWARTRRDRFALRPEAPAGSREHVKQSAGRALPRVAIGRPDLPSDHGQQQQHAWSGERPLAGSAAKRRGAPFVPR